MKLSVLVCAYNAAASIERCVLSILNQPMSDFEVIVVDDGSSDDTLAILNRLASEHVQLKVVHQANGGVASARNTALSIASGEYVTYLDSDDYLVENAYPAVLEQCELGYDIICFDAYKENQLGSVPFKMVVGESGEISSQQYYLSDPAPWNKFMKKELFEGLAFPTGLIYEDYACIPCIVNEAKKIYYLNQNVVNYVLGDESIMRSAHYKEKSMNIIQASHYLAKHTDMTRFKAEFEKVLYEHVLVSSCRYFISYQKIANANECGQLVKQYCPNVLNNQYLQLSLKERFIGWCFLNNHANWVEKLVRLKH